MNFWKMKLTKVLDFFEGLYYDIKNPIVYFYYNVKWYFRNQVSFFKILYSHRPWDYRYTLEITKRSLELQIRSIEKYSNEVDEDKNKKIKKFKRAIHIIDISDDIDAINLLVYERTGLKYEDHNTPFKYKKLEDGNFLIENETTDTFRFILKTHNEIEQELWNELWDIFRGNAEKQDGSDLRGIWY